MEREKHKKKKNRKTWFKVLSFSQINSDLGLVGEKENQFSLNNPLVLIFLSDA